MDTLKAEKRLRLGIITIILLIICLCITTFALAFATVSVENNIFSTASVSLNLNNGAPIINDDEVQFAPGVAVQKEFFIMNTGTVDAWYKLYFTNVNGKLADKIEVIIANGETVVHKGLLSSLTEENVRSTDDALAVGEKRELTITFYMPLSAGDDVQSEILTFDITADAVQKKNNPDRLFD